MLKPKSTYMCHIGEYKYDASYSRPTSYSRTVTNTQNIIYIIQYKKYKHIADRRTNTHANTSVPKQYRLCTAKNVNGA